MSEGHVDGEAVSVSGGIVLSQGLDINYDDIVDFVTNAHLGGVRLYFYGDSDAQCNILEKGTSNIDWLFDAARSTYNTCPFSPSLAIGYGELDSNGDMIVVSSTGNYRLVYTLKGGSTFFTTRRIVEGTIQGTYRSAGQIQSNLTSIVVPSISNTDFVTGDCKLRASTTDILDCDTSGGGAGYRGITGVPFSMFSGTDSSCNIHEHFDGSGAVLFTLAAGSTCPVVPGNVISGDPRFYGVWSD